MAVCLSTWHVPRSSSLRRAGTCAVIGRIRNLSSHLQTGVLLGRRWLIRAFPVCRAGSGNVTPGQLKATTYKAEKKHKSGTFHVIDLQHKEEFNCCIGCLETVGPTATRTCTSTHMLPRRQGLWGRGRTLCACHSRAPTARPHALSEFTSISTHIVFF